MAYPTAFRYTKDHEWIQIDGKRARVGITDHAQSELGDVVFVELPSMGTVVKKGAQLGTVESVKAVSDVFAPLGGKVVAVNKDLETSPETVNQSPHEAGWLVVLEIADSAEANDLLDAKAYEALIA